MSSPQNSRERYDELWSHLWANLHAVGPMVRTSYRLACRWLGFSPSCNQRMLDVGADNGAFMGVSMTA